MKTNVVLTPFVAMRFTDGGSLLSGRESQSLQNGTYAATNDIQWRKSA